MKFYHKVDIVRVGDSRLMHVVEVLNEHLQEITYTTFITPKITGVINVHNAKKWTRSEILVMILVTKHAKLEIASFYTRQSERSRGIRRTVHKNVGLVLLLITHKFRYLTALVGAKSDN